VKQNRIRVTRARPEVIQYLRGAMEVVVLAMAALSPWAFGGVDPVFELALAAGVGILLALWAGVAVLNGRFSWLRCPVTACLAAIFLVGVLQLLPLPTWVLTVVSPGTAWAHTKLEPSQPEQLTPDEAVAAPAALHAISVYPHATRAELFRWLGVLVLFAVVRNHVASTASLRRLTIVMTVNGALLAVVGLAQAFSSQKGLLYWSYPSAGLIFGPFINRNHFAGYLNLCIALGAGLLLLTGPSELDKRRTIIRKPNAPQEQVEEEGVVFSPLAVLHSPPQLWTSAALALMFAGLVCSLSRGGVAALLVALTVTLVLRLVVGKTWRLRRLEFLVVPAVLVLALLAWLGVKPLETRLGAAFKGDTIEDNRWQLWGDLMHLVPRFPVFGSGFGTISYIEPLVRSRGTFMSSGDVAEPNYVIEHAHNDYLEALIEGGILRFGLTLLLVGLVFAEGFRALRRFAGRTPGAYAFAGMLGFLALAFHSAVDFSLTTPAVAVLAAVVVAQLLSLNRADPTVPVSASHHRVVTMHLPPLGQAAVVATALLLGAVLVLHAWQADRVHRLRVGAFLALKPSSSQPPDYKEGLTYLQAAANADPADADLQLELGQVYLDAGEAVRQAELKLLQNQRSRDWHLYLAVLEVGTADPAAALVSVLAWNAPVAGRDQLPLKTRERLFDEFVVPGLRHMALARRLCPLLARPHIRFAAHAADLVHADQPEVYWERARLVAPSDADLWYYSGVQQLKDGKREEAFKSWKRSLELSRRHLDAILDAAIPRLGADVAQRAGHLMDEVLPDDAEVYLRAALKLDPDQQTLGQLKPLLEHGLKLLTDRTDALSAREYYLRARFRQFLGQTDSALRDYEQALTMAPNQPEWRIQFKDLLIDQEKWKEALRELEILKRQAPYPQIDSDIQRVEQKARGAL
jgi:O-antigen ligase/tetratricopeptide (TPR) repeat protein